MKILHISDNHGRFYELPDTSQYDVIVHSGDFCPNKTRGQLPFEEGWQSDWLWRNADRIYSWLGSGKVPVLICSGNHDFVEPADVLNETNSLGFIRLSERVVEVDGVKFYGHSYTPYFTGEWHNELKSNAETLCVASAMQYVANGDCDVFVSHGPLRGILDKNQYDQCCGSDILKYALGDKYLPNLPKLFLCGHIHESYGKTAWSSNGKTMMIYNSATTWQIAQL